VDLSAQSITFRTNKGITKDAGYKALEGAVANLLFTLTKSSLVAPMAVAFFFATG
jgi:hypothetical protein